MEVKLDSLIPYERLKHEIDAVFQVVDKNGNVVVLKDNQPAYIILKYAVDQEVPTKIFNTNYIKYTLQEAMRIVLLEAEGHTMHAAELADAIYNRHLYLQRDGSKARYNQIRARCSHYPDLFEALPGNVITLKEEATT